jgi:hypothetical protein
MNVAADLFYVEFTKIYMLIDTLFVLFLTLEFKSIIQQISPVF